jgi:hypothetical protein
MGHKTSEGWCFEKLSGNGFKTALAVQPKAPEPAGREYIFHIHVRAGEREKK